MVAPHRRDVAEVFGHAASMHEEGEVGGKDGFAHRSEIKAREARNAVHHMMRKAVEQEKDRRGDVAAAHLTGLVADAEVAQEHAAILVGLDQSQPEIGTASCREIVCTYW